MPGEKSPVHVGNRASGGRREGTVFACVPHAFQVGRSADVRFGRHQWACRVGSHRQHVWLDHPIVGVRKHGPEPIGQFPWSNPDQCAKVGEHHQTWDVMGPSVFEYRLGHVIEASQATFRPPVGLRKRNVVRKRIDRWGRIRPCAWPSACRSRRRAHADVNVLSQTLRGVVNVPNKFPPPEDLADETLLAVQGQIRLFYVVDHTACLQAAEVEQRGDPGVEQRAMLHGHGVLIRPEIRHCFVKGPAPCAFSVHGRGRQIVRRDSTRVVAVERLHRFHHFLRDGIWWEGGHHWQRHGSIPRQAVLCVKRPFSTDWFSVFGHQDAVCFSRLTVEGVHPPWAFFAHGTVEERAIRQPTCVLLHDQHSLGFQWFQGKTRLSFGPPHGMNRPQHVGLRREDGLVRSVVVKHHHGMSRFLSFEGKVTQVGQHQCQFLLMVRPLFGLPCGFD